MCDRKEYSASTRSIAHVTEGSDQGHSQEGNCATGHMVGDVFTFDWDTNEIEGMVCLHALYSMMPKIYALAHGADVAFATAEDCSMVARHACPDGSNPVIFELKRL